MMSQIQYAEVLTLLKKPSNYYPVSNLPVLEKVIKEAVAKQLKEHLDNVGFLDISSP